MLSFPLLPFLPCGDGHHIPIAASGQQGSQATEPELIHLVETILYSTIDIQDRYHHHFFFLFLGSAAALPLPLPRHLDDDRHDDLAAAIGVARDMAREPGRVRDDEGFSVAERRAADALAGSDSLARGFSLEGTQDQGWGRWA